MIKARKACQICGVEKAREEFAFYRDKRYSKICYKPWCLGCKTESSRRKVAKLKSDPIRWAKWKRDQQIYFYGLKPHQYDEMLAKQNGKCAICGSTSTKTKRTNHMFIDHDHVTGKVRGLLCHRCNNGLACYEDNRALLESAIKYLEYNLSTSTQQVAA